jgi:predicted AAA+ superfamily ATPase
MEYHRRLIDDFLDENFKELPVILIEGAKGVGKTATARNHSKTMFALDNSIVRQELESDLQMIDDAEKPLLIDEWQFSPDVWNHVRRMVDEGLADESILFTGSSIKVNKGVHSGAGRFVFVTLRPLSIEEVYSPEERISIRSLLDKPRRISGETQKTLKDYLDDSFASSMPGIRELSELKRELVLDGYVDNIINHEFNENGFRVIKPNELRAWLRAYSASMGTVTSFASILEMSGSEQIVPLSKPTANEYRQALEILFLIEEIPQFLWEGGIKKNLSSSPKHFVFDTGIALRLLGLQRQDIYSYKAPEKVKNFGDDFVGQILENLSYQSLKVYSEILKGELSHFRTKSGDHEIDFVLRIKNKVILFEIKANPSVKEEYVKHLNWLEKQLLDEFEVVKVILNTGNRAYTRQEDGVHVVPLGMLTH